MAHQAVILLATLLDTELHDVPGAEEKALRAAHCDGTQLLVLAQHRELGVWSPKDRVQSLPTEGRTGAASASARVDADFRTSLPAEADPSKEVRHGNTEILIDPLHIEQRVGRNWHLDRLPAPR
jgi:hypothetical protein